jgi:hypothetical protein
MMRVLAIRLQFDDTLRFIAWGHDASFDGSAAGG